MQEVGAGSPIHLINTTSPFLFPVCIIIRHALTEYTLLTGMSLVVVLIWLQMLLACTTHINNLLYIIHLPLCVVCVDQICIHHFLCVWRSTTLGSTDNIQCMHYFNIKYTYFLFMGHPLFAYANINHIKGTFSKYSNSHVHTLFHISDNVHFVERPHINNYNVNMGV